MDAAILPDTALRAFWATGLGAPADRRTASPCPAATGEPSEQGFVFLQWQLRASGGLCDADTVAMRIREHRSQPISWLARAIVAREVLHFEWRSRLFVPMFQFEPADFSLRAGNGEVLASVGAMDDWSLATWFATPHARLRGRCPADAVAASHGWAVLAAAKAERFIITKE